MMKWLFRRLLDLPAFAQVLQQRLALKLYEHINGVDPGINQITQNEIDNPVSAPEGYGRLGPFLSERIESGPFTSGQHERECS